MTINEQTARMLQRIANDSPVQGDGKMFLEFLAAKRYAALEASIALDDKKSCWKQGEAIGLGELLKEFDTARGSR